MGQGDLEGAIRDGTRALELAPNNATSHFNRGIARAPYTESLRKLSEAEKITAI